MKYDINLLSLDEKIELLTGKNVWELNNANGKLPNVFLADGPNGLRKIDIKTNTTKNATQMPALSLLANTWDTSLARLEGETIADDCLENNADVLLAPGVNIKRTPLNGRNFEYFSEDPFLAGTMAKAYIEGVQSKGVGTSLKHFCANNREYDRLYQSSEVDIRTLYEIYLVPFEIALEAKPWTVMCSYNPVNGVWASENKWLLQDILRNKLGFDGVIVSDWWAVHNHYKTHKASLDLEMPSNNAAFGIIKKAYESGLISITEIDNCVNRILTLMDKVTSLKQKVTTTKEQRHENALKIAREGMVLLKNEDNILPLKNDKVLIAGYNYAEGGGGSAKVTTDFDKKSIVEELKLRYSDENQVIDSQLNIGRANILNQKHTFIKASNCDKVVIIVSNDDVIEGEGFDRTSLKLSPIQEDFIINISNINKNIIVVINAGCVIDMSSWIDKVKGVLYAGFGGESSNQAISDILCGKVSPCGKLTETFPMCIEDVASEKNTGNGFVERYDDGLFVGYRYYDSFNKQVMFSFGYGLSYGEFSYSNLIIEKIDETNYNVNFTITNNSDITAKEIAQVYVKDVFSNVSRPEKELKGFSKVELSAHESKTITIPLSFRSFAFYSIPLNAWHIENGVFEIMVGASSRDIKLRDTIEINLPEENQYSI